MLGVFKTLRAFDALSRDPFLVFLEPPALDRRILNQFALFSLMSSPMARIDAWLEQHPRLCRRVLIPAKLKWEIRDKLDQANVNERILFPDLDGLSRWLTRYYMPKSAAERLAETYASSDDINAHDRNRGTRRTRSAPRRPASRPRASRR